MTVAALQRLLTEIDTQGGPNAARHNRLHLPDEGVSMTTAPALRPAPPAADAQLKAAADVHLRPTAQTAETLSVGQLLKWGDDHDDAEVQDQAARARVFLTGLRRRHAADQELTAITEEREQLEQRLAALRTREAELAPAKKTKKKPPQRDYDTRTVRAWAAENGVDCPRVGQIPKRVLEQWRASLPHAG